MYELFEGQIVWPNEQKLEHGSLYGIAYRQYYDAEMIASNMLMNKYDKADEPLYFHSLRVRNNALNIFLSSYDNPIDRFEDREYVMTDRWLFAIKAATVAMLHDIIEDTETTLEDLKYQFSQEILDAVDHITRRKGESYADYIGRVSVNDLSRAVKIADLQDNMNITRLRSRLGNNDMSRLFKYHNAYWYLLGVRDSFTKADCKF